MVERKEILFHPCPSCFPELWKQRVLAKPEPTARHIQLVKQIYNMPEDGTGRAVRLCQSWGVSSIEEIAVVYARAVYCQPHGFLVLNNQLTGPRLAIEDMFSLRRFIDEQQLSQECMERAESFGLPKQKVGGGSWAENMGKSHHNNHFCLPKARRTWSTT